ncbi:MAG: ribonuclease P protein component [Rhodobacteraceae bacterium]|nr:ribonuclease P protein component [Paracoccaceae bacterium]
MTAPSGSDVARQDARAADAPAALSCAMPETLRQRADFLSVAKARRMPCPAFLLQARVRGDGAAMRVGFTCSKKLGNAVTRNRAKRRLRAIARQVLPRHGQAGWDYVLVGRPQATVSRDFAAMCADLRAALAKLHQGGKA